MTAIKQKKKYLEIKRNRKILAMATPVPPNMAVPESFVKRKMKTPATNPIKAAISADAFSEDTLSSVGTLPVDLYSWVSHHSILPVP